MTSRVPSRTDQGTAGPVSASTSDEIESLRIGNGGWVRHRRPNGATTIYLRFEDIHERLTCVELYFSDGVSPNALPRVKLVDLETWANTEGIRDAVRANLDIAGPLLRVAASHFDASTSWG